MVKLVPYNSPGDFANKHSNIKIYYVYKPFLLTLFTTVSIGKIILPISSSYNPGIIFNYYI